MTIIGRAEASIIAAIGYYVHINCITLAFKTVASRREFVERLALEDKEKKMRRSEYIVW